MQPRHLGTPEAIRQRPASQTPGPGQRGQGLDGQGRTGPGLPQGGRSQKLHCQSQVSSIHKCILYWFIDKKWFTNKPKLLILFAVMKKLRPEFLVIMNKDRSGSISSQPAYIHKIFM